MRIITALIGETRENRPFKQIDVGLNTELLAKLKEWKSAYRFAKAASDDAVAVMVDFNKYESRLIKDNREPFVAQYNIWAFVDEEGINFKVSYLMKSYTSSTISFEEIYKET